LFEYLFLDWRFSPFTIFSYRALRRTSLDWSTKYGRTEKAKAHGMYSESEQEEAYAFLVAVPCSLIWCIRLKQGGYRLPIYW